MSGAFPMTVTKLSLCHRVHSKDYHLIMVNRADGKSLLINRWGKRGSFGQMQCFQFADVASAAREFESKVSEKEKRGYDPERRATNMAANELDLKSLLLTVFNMLGADNVKFLLPDADVTRVHEPPELEQDPVTGRWFNKNQVRPKTVKELEPTLAERVAADPEWGAW